MFNLFQSNSTQESVTKKTSPVVTLPLSLFSKDEVKEFQRKVKLATLNNIAPTVSSVLNQDLTKAVEFLGWAEVSTEDDNQLTYPKDDKGMPVNIRKKGTNTQNVNKFADAFLDGSFSYAVEQPWGVFTRQECKPYLFIDAKGNLTVKDVRIDQYNCEDLALIYDLQSSLFSAQATIVSALQRNESRGAHQRSDFPLLDPLCEFNCLVSMDDNNNLKISNAPLKELNEKQKTIVANAKRDDDIRNKLLE